MEIIKKCECGKILKAKSKSQMEYNLRLHLETDKHKRQIKEGKFEKCEECGKPPKHFIHIHHKNGNHKDDREKNRVYLCEDCHYIKHSNNNLNKTELDKK